MCAAWWCSAPAAGAASASTIYSYQLSAFSPGCQLFSDWYKCSRDQGRSLLASRAKATWNSCSVPAGGAPAGEASPFDPGVHGLGLVAPDGMDQTAARLRQAGVYDPAEAPVMIPADVLQHADRHEDVVFARGIAV